MTMIKGFVVGFMALVLTVGTVAAATSNQAAQSVEQAQVTAARTMQQAEVAMQSARPDAPLTPAKPQRAAATLTLTDLSHDVTDGEGATVSAQATGVLRNTGKGALDLREVHVMLTDADGKAIPARIEFLGDGKGVLERGEEIPVRLHFADLPTDAGALRISLDAPGGGAVVNAISITIECSWPPLKCKITITFDL